MCVSNPAVVRFAIVLTVLGAATGTAALAQETVWTPPDPSPDEGDWIKLTSGEWLRGNIDLYRDEVLYFDSDELDDLEIDWEDIAEIRSAQAQTLTFADGEVVFGSFALRDGIIKVNTTAGVREFRGADLMSILEGRPRELNFWSLKATLGIIARSGNSEQADATAFLRLRREATRSRFDISYTGNIGSIQKTQNVNNHLVGSTFNVYMTRRLFITPIGAEVFSDRFQNIDYRATVGAGLGYYIFRQSKFDWFLSLNGAYQSIRYISVLPDESRTKETGAIIPTLNLDWDITGDVELEIDYNAQIGVPEAKNAFHYLFVLLSIELSSYLDWDTSFQWNRNENPVADADGNIPERDDYRISVGLGLDI